MRRTEALTASQGQNEEVKHHHADIAYLTDAPDLEARLRALLPQSDESFSSASESVRIRYAYVLGRRGDAAQAKALVDEAERLYATR